MCYEIAFPNIVHQDGQTADILMTMSNDGWFGDSHGPEQHFQMAQFRAIELGKPLIRVTNTGITGLINHQGKVTNRLPKSIPELLIGEIQTTQGMTPYTKLGPNRILALLAILSFSCLYFFQFFAKKP